MYAFVTAVYHTPMYMYLTECRCDVYVLVTAVYQTTMYMYLTECRCDVCMCVIFQLVSRRSVRRNIASMGNKFLKMIGVGGPQVNSAIAEEQRCVCVCVCVCTCMLVSVLCM